MDKEITDIVSKAAGIPELLKEVYGDLAKPGVSQVGKALSAVLGLGNTVLYPLHLINEKTRITLENNLEKYREKLENIPEEKIILVPPEVGVPIAEKLTYVSNEEISEMYLNLLANSSNSDTASIAHPGFAKMIENLSPDEALILQTINFNRSFPFIEIRLNNSDSTWHTIADFVVTENIMSKINFKNNFRLYMSNLDSLGIIKIRRDIWMAPVEAYYPPLWESVKPSYAVLEKSLIGTDKTLGYEKARADITPYGELFIAACFTSPQMAQ
jgi:Abortive infection alpha